MDNPIDTPPLQTGWSLVGHDSQGRPLRLLIADPVLEQRYPGVSIGRHPALCELIIDDPGISHRHLRLSLSHGRLWVEDLNSLNGSQVNGLQLTPFQPVPLAPGQQLRAGRVVLSINRVTD